MGPGVLPASVTPLLPNGDVDHVGVVRLLAHFKTSGCSGVVLAGTNGEGPSLSAVEKRDLVKGAVNALEGFPIVLGVATSSLDEAIWSCESARKVGAAGALVMAPGYFREASADGIAQWFEALASKTELPLLIYNFPQRNGIVIPAETIARLCRLDNVHGLKDSSGDLANVPSFAEAAKGKLLYTGAESILLECLSAGWSGTISGASNVLAGWLSQIVREWSTDRESAETKYALIAKGLKALRSGAQPGLNKGVLHHMNLLDNPAPKLPLLPLAEAEVLAAWEELKPLVA
jgi:4-hydroxy-tetrahydrodipicolinate synthase